MTKMTKKSAEALIKEMERGLHLYVQKRLEEIEAVANEHGIVHYFRGLPPFDEYGNSGWYYPVKENGEPWLGSDENHHPNENGEFLGWVSSDQGC